VLTRLIRAAIHILIAAALLWFIATAPLPTSHWELVVFVRVPLAVFVFIVYVGKTLYDTFFYERKP